MKNNRKIAFEDFGTTLPIVKFTLGSEQIYAIIDSGSEQTVFEKRFVKNHKDLFKIRVEKAALTMTGVSQSPANVNCIFAKADLWHGDAETGEGVLRNVEGIIMPLDHLSEHFSSQGITIAALIGSDILQPVHAHIDYENRQLVLPADIVEPNK